MKPAILFLIAGAIAALLSTWLLVGTDSATPIGAEERTGAAGTSLGAGQAVAMDAELDGVDPRSDAKAGIRGNDRRSLVTREPMTTEVGAVKDVLEAATGPYTGRLLDPQGRPMAGIEVTLDSWEEALRDSTGVMRFGAARKRKPEAATTGDDGKFALEPRKSFGRSLGVRATVAGYSDDPVQCILDPEKGRELGDVTLAPAVIVSGWIRDADDRAVSGARVRRVNRNGDGASDLMDQIGFGGLVEATRSDADGRFEMLHEDEGPISLQIDHDDILPKLWDGPTRRAGEVLQDVVIHVERAGRIDGYVVGYPPGRKRGMVAAAVLDDVDGSASDSSFSELMAAQISPAGDDTTSIEADGSFTLPGLVPGARYRLRAITKNLFVHTVELSEAVDARAGGEPVTLQFDPGTNVTFQVTDAKTQKPIETLTVSGKYGSEPAFLQLDIAAGDPPDRFPEGKVTVYELRPKSAPQRLALTIDAPGYFRTREVTVDVPASGTVNLGKIALAPAPLLKFRVVDAATKKPIRRARITVEPTSPRRFDFDRRGDRETDEGTDDEKEQKEAVEAMVFGEYRVRSRGRTERDGRCPLSMVEADQVSLEIKARGYATYVMAPFVAPADDEDEIVIELFGGGSLRAIVTDTSNDAAASVRVECQRQAGERTVKNGETSDENGVAEFEHLAPGTWEVRAFRTETSPFAEGGQGSASHDAEWVEVQVSSGALTQVELEVPAVGDLTGIVLLGHRPSQDARVSLTKIEHADRAESLIEFQDQFAGLNADKTTGVTDFEGRFTLTDIIPDEYILLTRHPDLAMIIRTEVTVDAGANSITVEIPSTSLTGRILDDDGAPIAGAAVSVNRHADDEANSERAFTRQFLGSSGSATATTDVDGVYELLGVTAGIELALAVEAKGFADTRHGPIRAILNDTVPVAPIVMERAGTLVVSTGAAEIASTMSFARAQAVGGHALEVDADDKVGIMRGGTSRIEGLVSGTWEVTVQSTAVSPGQESTLTTLGPKTVEVKPGETAEVNF